MKRVALFSAVALVFAIVAPAYAQPFADVPTDIFAFDAVAELAAKGIIEGYPDGTFKGDRAMTRYEMAMVVARLLARIEAIKIPPAPPAAKPEVTRTDVTALQRLLNEFRAELAAQGVRVTAVEEELAAIKAKLSNVKFTGDVRFRYSFYPSGSPSSGAVTGVPQPIYRNRTQFVGQVAPNVKATTRIISGGGSASSNFNFDTAAANTTFGLVGFDTAYLDLDPLWGVSWRLGRQYYTLAPVGLAANGLLFDPPDSGTFSGLGPADGLLAKGAVGGFKWEAGVWRAGPGSTTSIGDFWTGAVSFNVIPGWSLRLSGLGQARNGVAAIPNTTDTGWSADFGGTVIPGLNAGAAYATFNGYTSTTTQVSSNSYIAWLTFDLSQFGGLSTWSPTLGLQYKNYGNVSTPVPTPTYSAAVTDTVGINNWNFTGWAVDLKLKFTPDLSGEVEYESGNCNFVASNCPTAGASLNEWSAFVDYNLATRTVLQARWFQRTVGGVSTAFGTTNFYRIQLSYSY